MIYTKPLYKNLKNVNVFLQDLDNSKYIKIYDLSKILSIGKHSFLIDINKNQLLPSSQIEIQIIDQNNTTSYIQIPQFVQNGMRRVSFIIDQNHINGNCQIIINCILNNSNVIPDNFLYRYNYRLIINTTIMKQYNNLSTLRFYQDIKVKCKQYQLPLINVCNKYEGKVWNNITQEWQQLQQINLNDLNIQYSKVQYNTVLTKIKQNFLISNKNIFLKRYQNKYLQTLDQSQNVIQKIKILQVISKNIIKFQLYNYEDYLLPHTHIKLYYNTQITQNNKYMVTDDKGNIINRCFLSIQLSNLKSYSGKLKSIKTYYKLSNDQNQNYKFLGQVTVQNKNLLSYYKIGDLLQDIGIIDTNVINNWFNYQKANDSYSDNTSQFRDNIIIGELQLKQVNNQTQQSST